MSLSSSSHGSSTQSLPSNIVIFDIDGYGASHTTKSQYSASPSTSPSSLLSLSPQPKCKKLERLRAVRTNLLPSFKAEERKEEHQTVESLEGKIRDLEAKLSMADQKYEEAIVVMQDVQAM